MSANARFLHVGIGSVNPPNTALEKTFSTAMDWIRYSTHSWILYTNVELDVWRDRIRNTEGIQASDSFFLSEFSEGEYSGYQQEAVWKWLGKPR